MSRPADTREDRLAAKLRENLQRRKARSRQIAAQGRESGDAAHSSQEGAE